MLSFHLVALELGVPPDTTCQRSLQCIALHLHRNMRRNDSSQQHRKRSPPSSRLRWVLALDQELGLALALVKALELEPEPEQGLVPERLCLELEQGLVLEPACSWELELLWSTLEPELGMGPASSYLEPEQELLWSCLELVREAQWSFDLALDWGTTHPRSHQCTGPQRHHNMHQHDNPWQWHMMNHPSSNCLSPLTTLWLCAHPSRWHSHRSALSPQCVHLRLPGLPGLANWSAPPQEC